MYKNKAFEKIKYSKSCIENLHHGLKNDKRQSKWKKQRAKYGGWDERATWNLNLFMTEHIIHGLPCIINMQINLWI